MLVLVPYRVPGSADFVIFAISNPDSISDSILGPSGLPSESLLAPKMTETCLEIPLGAPKSRSKDVFFGSKKQKRGFQKGAKNEPQTGSPLHWI